MFNPFSLLFSSGGLGDDGPKNRRQRTKSWANRKHRRAVHKRERQARNRGRALARRKP